MTNRIRLTIAYDGTPFAGWQSQPGGNTIQDHLQRAAAEICGQTLVFHGSGRTDAGVHALGQVAHVDVPASDTMGPKQWQAALNSTLPPTIRILHAKPCDEAFHAQYSCTGKTYRYRIAHAPVLPPQLHQRAWHLHGPLDLQSMESAGTAFLGYHDFACFCASRGKDASGRSQDPNDTRRHLRHINIQAHSLQEVADTPVIDIEFSGDGFLYKMVRMLSAALVRAAQGKVDTDTLRAMLANPAGEKWHHTAPAAGLSLTRVDYPDSNT
jgi:tRNA pseudouridine38-40 synthase